MFERSHLIFFTGFAGLRPTRMVFGGSRRLIAALSYQSARGKKEQIKENSRHEKSADEGDSGDLHSAPAGACIMAGCSTMRMISAASLAASPLRLDWAAIFSCS